MDQDQWAQSYADEAAGYDAWGDETPEATEETPAPKGGVEARVERAQNTIAELEAQEPTYERGQKIDALRNLVKQAEERAPFQKAADEDLATQAFQGRLESEAKMREAESWPTGSAHREMLEEQAKQAKISSLMAEKETENREASVRFRMYLAEVRETKAVEAATQEVRQEWVQKYQELFAQSGLTDNPDFRTKDPNDPTIPPAYLLDEAKWKAKNLLPSEERIQTHRARLAAEDYKKHGHLDITWELNK